MKLPSIFWSPKAVSKGGPNKFVVISEAGVCWLLQGEKNKKQKTSTRCVILSFRTYILQLTMVILCFQYQLRHD